MVNALFVLGHAGSGKTQFSKKFIKSRLKQKEMWALMDKDTSGDCLGTALMMTLGLNPNDRDSLEYKNKVRDLEYQACLDMARDQLKLGINVVLPGPWTKELETGKLFSSKDLGFPKGTKLNHVYLDAPEFKIKQRIIERNNIRDEWKINNWEEFAKRLKKPKAIIANEVLTFNTEEEFGQQEKLLLAQLNRR